MVTELVLLTQARHRPAWVRPALLNLLQWGLAALLVFGAIAWVWGQGSLQSSLGAHFSQPLPGQADVGGETPADFALSPSLFLRHADGVAPALVGIVLLFKRRQMRQGMIPAIWLLTALAVHSAHRPWWSYYYLHLAIPLAWLAGLAAGEALGFVSQRLQARQARPGTVGTWPAVLVCALTALVLAGSLGRLDGAVRDLRQRPRVASSAVIGRMKEYGHEHAVGLRRRSHLCVPCRADYSPGTGSGHLETILVRPDQHGGDCGGLPPPAGGAVATGNCQPRRSPLDEPAGQ